MKEDERRVEESTILREERWAHTAKCKYLSMELHGHGFEEFFERHTWRQNAA
jgi:hypothetical protein